MVNHNLKQAQKVKDKFYKNIKIEIFPNEKMLDKKDNKPYSCQMVSISNKQTGEFILEQTTTNFFANDTANDFENLFLREDLKQNFLNKDLGNVLNKSSIIGLSNIDYCLEINNCIENTFANLYEYSAFQDTKGKKVKYIPSFCAYYGLWQKNKEIYFRQHNEAFCKNNPNLQFEGNKIYNYREIGEIFGLKGESTRQKIERVLLYFSLRFLINFEEMIYKINYIIRHQQDYIIINNIENLSIYTKLFNDLFDIYEESIGFYIDLSTGLIIKNGISFEDIMNNETVPYNVRRKLEERFNKVSIYIDGKKLIDNKKELMKYYIKTYCAKPTKLKDIQKQYKQMLVKNNIKDRDDLFYDDRRLDNILAKSHDVLLSFGKEYRYYESAKIKELVKLLNLSIYNDIVISANKIYKDNLDLMEEYDIRNYYELHNLLNKTVNDNNITFKKMPTICFGEANRDTQVLELLKELSPINASNLAKAYEEKYGDAENTIIGSYFNSIAKYKVGNKYIYN